MGMTGFAGKREEWQKQDEDMRASGQPDPYQDIDSRAKDFIRARIPKKLKEGATKFNEPGFEEVEKAVIEASKDSGSYEVQRGHDLLTEVLGTPEHRGRVRGVQSKMNWNTI